MKIGIQVNNFTWPGGDKEISNKLEAVARTADEAGFYSLWVMDHFFQIMYVGKPEEPMLEAYTTLGFIAGVTKNIKLGTMVTGVIYREPALLIKAVTTLDVLSQGRAYFGIGAAWNEEESKALGFNFPPLKERFERLEDTLKIANQMFKGDEKAFKGKYQTLLKPMNHPQVLSKPHPPILIGGGGEQKTLKLVAKYANACNLFAQAGEVELTHKLNILKNHCKEIGRDYSEIEKTVLSHVDNDVNVDEVFEECKKLRNLGIDHVIYSISDIYKLDALKRFGKEIIPEIEKL